jgi:hypothetical protein
MKFIQKLQTTINKLEFLDGEEISFDLPNNIVDISSFSNILLCLC